MVTNKCDNWVVGLPFVQWGINNDYHSGIKRTPFELRFGQKPTCGISDLPIARDFLARLKTEQDLWDALPLPYRDAIDEAERKMHDGDTEVNDPRAARAAAAGVTGSTEVVVAVQS